MIWATVPVWVSLSSLAPMPMSWAHWGLTKVSRHAPSGVMRIWNTAPGKALVSCSNWSVSNWLFWCWTRACSSCSASCSDWPKLCRARAMEPISSCRCWSAMGVSYCCRLMRCMLRVSRPMGRDTCSQAIQAVPAHSSSRLSQPAQVAWRMVWVVSIAICCVLWASTCWASTRRASTSVCSRATAGFRLRVRLCKAWSLCQCRVCSMMRRAIAKLWRACISTVSRRSS